MATTIKALFRGAATTTVGTVLYTVPASTTTSITNIAVTNTSGTAYTFTILLNNIELHTATTIAANTTVYIDCKQVLTAAQTLKGWASNAAIMFHFNGVEVA